MYTTQPHSGARQPSFGDTRSGSPEMDHIDPAQRANPFATPYGSRPVSHNASSSALQMPETKWFHSRRVKKGSVERPWMEKKDPKEKWVTIIPMVGIFIGLVVSGVLIWDGLRSVVTHEYCPVLSENWSGGINEQVWLKEGEVGGFGNGQFEQTTTTDENIFVKDGMLYIKPTLQDAQLIDTDNSFINLTADGTCASERPKDCYRQTNHTTGAIVNPVKSGRISTKNGAKIRYGRVEVEARLPSGDWLWPAIWLLPNDNTYGPWPRSGEIDIIESRGNNHTFPQGGNDIVSSTLHWGPNPANDGWYRNNVKRQALHTTYAKDFHTFGLEWSEKYLFTYVDTRLLQVTYVDFNTPFFKRGQFPLSDSNGTRLDDPWSFTGRSSTPFDQDFYLILNVGVGATNGWFKDGSPGKPWVDTSPNAAKDFWDARDTWHPTWEQSGEMVVKSVKMWQQKGYNGC